MHPNRGLVVVQASDQQKRSNNCMRVFAGCNSRTSLFANRIRALRKQLQYCTGLRGTPPAAPAALRSLPSDLIRGSSSGEQRRKPLPRPEDPRFTLLSGQQKRSKQLHARFRRVQFSDITFRQPHQGLAKTIAVLHRFQGAPPNDSPTPRRTSDHGCDCSRAPLWARELTTTGNPLRVSSPSCPGERPRKRPPRPGHPSSVFEQ